MSRSITTPGWLDESFLRTVLQQGVHPNRVIKVSSVEVTQAVPPGANYASTLFRVRGCCQLENEPDKVKKVSVIVKALIATDIIGKFVEESGFMEKEYIVYKEFLPEVYHVLPKSERFTAKLLYSSDPKTLVLEDLNDQGFVMVDRVKQLDFEHCLVCLKTLAKFHAASVAVIKETPEFIVSVGKECMYNRENLRLNERISILWNAMKYVFTKAVQTWQGFEDFEQKSHRVWETLQDEMFDVFEPRKNSLNVMTHGDPWLSNMMFKYDSNGNIVDFRLLDFQVCRYGTPATDLVYFIFSSANQDVRENRLDELISIYLEALNSMLEQLDCEERLTREQLDEELKRCQCYIFVIMYTILATALTDPDELINIDEMTEENLKSADHNPFEKGFYGKYYKNIAPQVMRYLYEEGFFDRQRFSK